MKLNIKCENIDFQELALARLEELWQQIKDIKRLVQNILES